jgi:hypothetical protein
MTMFILWPESMKQKQEIKKKLKTKFREYSVEIEAWRLQEDNEPNKV